MSKEKMIRVSISIHESDWLELQKIAEEERSSASAVIRSLIVKCRKLKKDKQ